MGGLQTNYHGEVVTLKQTAIRHHVVPGLYSIGEAACVSVHGANRLGSNSLLDLVVFGRAAAIRAAETTKPNSRRSLPASACDKSLVNLDQLRNAAAARRRRRCGGDSMQRDYAKRRGGVSHRRELQQGVGKIQDTWRKSFEDVKAIGSQSGLELRSDRIDGIGESVGQAVVTIDSAYNRNESRGAHARVHPRRHREGQACAPDRGNRDQARQEGLRRPVPHPRRRDLRPPARDPAGQGRQWRPRPQEGRHGRPRWSWTA